MKVELYDNTAKATGEIELSEKIFNAPWNPDLVRQVLDAQLANARQPLAHTKGRGEVRGGGKKPWRQKGTGRARHGSIRSPIWKGGGVAHGPTKEKIFAVKINKKMRQAAVFSALSKKLNDGELKVVESIAVAEPKTKLAINLIRPFGESVLIIPSLGNKNIYRASANIPKIKSLSPASLNVYDLLCYKNVLLEKEAINAIENHYHAA
ncbi:MAG: 50S ribosomal protein L4 [Parcubacteria group bacterium]